jgi:hypothetical protein
MTSDRIIPLTLGAATMLPYGLLGGFGPGESVWPWLGMAAGWTAWVLIAREGARRGWWLGAQDEAAPMSPYYFALLGLTPTSTPEDVRREFRALAKQHHPDVGGDAETFRHIVEAREKVLEELT